MTVSRRITICVVPVEDELEENWQRLHPSFWSNGDVLDVIFYVASKSSHGPDAVHNLRGEKFQNLSGSDLYRMSRQDFRDRDSVYGDLLFDCIQELLSKSRLCSYLFSFHTNKRPDLRMFSLFGRRGLHRFRGPTFRNAMLSGLFRRFPCTIVHRYINRRASLTRT